MKGIAWAALFALAPNLTLAACQTPSSSTAALFLPYDFALFHSAPMYQMACIDQGYALTIARQDTACTNPSVGLEDFLDFLDDAFGCFYIDTHGGTEGLGVEAYELTTAGYQACLDACTAYIASGIVSSAEIFAAASLDGYQISIRPEAIGAHYMGASSVAFNQACYGQNYEQIAWPSARCRLGCYGSWIGVTESETFWTRMNGLEGPERRPAAVARQGTPIALGGAGNTTLSPAVTEFSHPLHTVIHDHGGLNIWWEFDTEIDTTVSPVDVIEADPDHFTVFDEAWESKDRLRACITGIEPGCGSIYLLGDAIHSATNPNSLLDGDGFGPSGDDYEVILCVDDNPTAGVWGFSVTGGLASWNVGIEKNTAAYILEGSTHPDGPWYDVGIPDPPGRGRHSVEVSGESGPWLRLVEVETSGRRRIHAVDREVALGAERQRPASVVNESSLLQQIEERLAAARRRPAAPVWSNGEKVVIFAPAAFAAPLAGLADYWSLQGYDPEIVEIDDIAGGPLENPDLFRMTLLASIVSHAQQGVRFFHLVGDWNDWHEVYGSDWQSYWTGWWADLREDHIASYPPTTAKLILPTFTVADTLPHLVGLGHDAPYIFTDQPFADTDGDGNPDVVVTRWPATESWEVALLVNKLMEYNSNHLPSPFGVTFYVHDWTNSPGSAARIRADADTIRAFVPAEHSVQQVNACPLGCDELHLATLTQWNSHLNDVAVILGTQSDEFEPAHFFDRTCGASSFYVDHLDNDHAVFVLAGSCDTGCWAYGDGADTSGTYVTPACEDFLIRTISNEGAIAWVGPTGASWQRGNAAILGCLVEEVFGDTSRSLAEAWTAAMQRVYSEYAGDTSVTKLARSYVFLGDPLTRLSAGLSTPTSAAAVGAADAEPRLLPSGPNPVRGDTCVRFALPRKTTVDVRVYDVRGRLVRTLMRDALPAGTHEIAWRGLNDDGHSVAAGIYYCRLQVQGATLTRKLVVLD